MGQILWQKTPRGEDRVLIDHLAVERVDEGACPFHPRDGGLQLVMYLVAGEEEREAGWPGRGSTEPGLCGRHHGFEPVGRIAPLSSFSGGDARCGERC